MEPVNATTTRRPSQRVPMAAVVIPTIGLTAAAVHLASGVTSTPRPA
jgi:hypothetical protein